MKDNLEKYEFFIKDITKKVSLQIIKQKKTIFPSDADIENDDIWSETRYQIIYLFRAYNPSLNIPLKNYIYKFLRKRVIDHLYKNIISLKREYQIKYFDVYQSNISLRASIEQKDYVAFLLNKANKLDREIMLRIYAGESYEEIAKDIGISKMAISKRMKKYGNQTKK